MADGSSAILDHEVTLRMKATARVEKQNDRLHWVLCSTGLSNMKSIILDLFVHAKPNTIFLACNN